jgi:hypothetical protein
MNTTKDNYFDKRYERETLIVDKKKPNARISLRLVESFNIDKVEISFYPPNIIALFVNIAERELSRARDLYKSFIAPKLIKRRKVNFSEKEDSRLFDYFEYIQISIISIYTAIEALANVVIPYDYTLEKINQKKIKETWDKISIERWMSTVEKIGSIVPDILKIRSPKNESFWSSFLKLEELRNDIIHQKTSKDNQDESPFKKLLENNIFEVIDSGFSVIRFFCDNAKHHSLLPYGFGKVEIIPAEIDGIYEKILGLSKRKSK